jgi:hypothetical protein
MTPQERELVIELFDRLAALENNPRDPEAERLISQGLARAPHALYPLVQTVLLQDEALRRANARIEELEGKAGESAGGGFLDSMRGTLLGRSASSGEVRGSVPTVRPGGVWNTGQASAGAPPQQPMPEQMLPGQAGGGAGSFLGTAAAAAVGMIGGSLLFNGIRNLMGGGHPAAFGSSDPTDRGASPWGSDASGSDLARQAGRDDVGANDFGGNRFAGDDAAQTAGLYDQNADDDESDDVGDDDFADSGYGDDGTSEA